MPQYHLGYAMQLALYQQHAADWMWNRIITNCLTSLQTTSDVALFNNARRFFFMKEKTRFQKASFNPGRSLGFSAKDIRSPAVLTGSGSPIKIAPVPSV